MGTLKNAVTSAVSEPLRGKAQKSPFEVWVVNHCLNSWSRIVGRYDRDDAIDIARRQVVNKRSFVEAIVRDNSGQTVFSVHAEKEDYGSNS